MGFRDLRGSLAQYNLVPVDPEAERQARIERFISDSLRLKGLEDEEWSLTGSETGEEWTVVYDKFQLPRR